MSPDDWAWFAWATAFLTLIMFLPVKYFLQALKRKKAYLKEQAKLEEDWDAFQALEELHAGESTHPPVPMSVRKFGRDLNWIEQTEEGSAKSIGPVYRRQPHRHRWIFVGRSVENVPPWPEVYEFECIADYYCQDKLRMDIKPMWGYIPVQNPHTKAFDRVHYKNRAAYMREMNHPMLPTIVVPEQPSE